MTSVFAVYDHPSDYPEHVVVREWQCSSGSTLPVDPPLLFPTVDHARVLLEQRGLFRVGRQAGDDATIVECWL